MLKTLLTGLLLSPFWLYSQIVNIESLRLQKDSSGLSGQEIFNFKITRNTTRLYEINNNLAVQYRQSRHIVLFLSNLNFTFSENTDFERNGFFHARYNYVQNDWLTYEYFNQYQIDIPLRIKERILTGLGPRFSFLNKKPVKFILGTLVMYEYDEELRNDIVHRDFRLSSYISLGYKNERQSLTALVYYQPRLDFWSDFRTSGQLQWLVKVWKGFALNITGVLAYDAFPVEDAAIPQLTYKLLNGVSYTF